MTRKEFDSFQQLIGQIISINTFFSASESLQVALAFVESLPHNDDCLPVIICIEPLFKPYEQRSYAKISHFSNYGDEEEVLFAMGHIFRVQSIEQLDRTNSLPLRGLEFLSSLKNMLFSLRCEVVENHVLRIFPTSARRFFFFLSSRQCCFFLSLSTWKFSYRHVLK